MALSDLITTTLYTDKIPSTGKLIKFRPFVVKEERALMMAQESGNDKTMLATLEQVVRSCVQGGATEELSTFDIEYLFVKLRAKSIEEFSSLIFTCGVCHEKNTISIPLETVYIKNIDKTEKIIKLGKDLSVELQFPSVSQLLTIESDIAALTTCIKTIFKGDEKHETKDVQPQEVIDFLENLQAAQYDLIAKFYDNIPETCIDVEWKCEKCGKDHKYELRGINDFF